MTKTALSLGGNLADPGTAIHRAVKKLEVAGLENIKLSSFYRSAPVNCPPGSPDFINCALTGEWNSTARELLELCQEIEIAAGRPRKHGRNAPRPLDIDIILFGAEQISEADLQIPHPRAAERRFVLLPLAGIAPEMNFPGTNKNSRELLAALPPALPGEITPILRPEAADPQARGLF